MKPLKIAMIMNIDFGKQGPSVHLFKDIIEQLLANGHRVTVYTKAFSDEYQHCPEELLGKDGLEIVEINCKKDGSNLVKRFAIDANYANLCSKKYKNQNFDVIFLQSCNSAYFHVKYLKKYAKNSKLIFNVQDIFPQNAKYIHSLPLEKFTYSFFYKMQSYAYKNVDEIITISEDMANTIKSDSSIKTPVTVVHNWGYSNEVNIIKDEDNLFIKENNINDDKLRVVYAGNIGRLQNIEIIVKAAKKLRDNEDIQFYIIGNGANKRKIVKHIEESGLTNVIIKDSQPENIAPYIYAMSDVNLIPLAVGIINTALPSKTAACLSYGRYIIGCFEKDTELGRLLNNTDGCFTVSNIDEDELVSIIKDIENEERRQEFPNRKEALETFGKDRNVKLYVKSFEEI